MSGSWHTSDIPLLEKRGILGLAASITRVRRTSDCAKTAISACLGDYVSRPSTLARRLWR